MRSLAATMSLKVSAILPDKPVWSPGRRTEKSPRPHRLQRMQQRVLIERAIDVSVAVAVAVGRDVTNIFEHRRRVRLPIGNSLDNKLAGSHR